MSSVVTTQCGWVSRFRIFLEPRLLLNQKAPPSQTPQTGIAWGLPSGQTAVAWIWRGLERPPWPHGHGACTVKAMDMSWREYPRD